MGETIEYVTGSATGNGGLLVLQESCVCKKNAGRESKMMPVALAVVLRQKMPKSFEGKITGEGISEVRDAEKKLSDWFQNKFVRKLLTTRLFEEKAEKLLKEAEEYVNKILSGYEYSGCICAGNMISFVNEGDSCGAYYVADQFGKNRLLPAQGDTENVAEYVAEIIDSTEILLTDVKIDGEPFYLNAIAEAFAEKRKEPDPHSMDYFLKEIIETENLECNAAAGIRITVKKQEQKDNSKNNSKNNSEKQQ